MDKQNMNKSEAKWHHEITHFPRFIIDGYITDSKKIYNFCSYTRWFLFKLFVVIPATLFVIGHGLGQWLAGFVALLTPGIPSHIYALWLYVNSCIVSTFLIVVLVSLWDHRKFKKQEALWKLEAAYRAGEKERPPEEPKKTEGFLTVWYKSFKGKYCPKMEY